MSDDVFDKMDALLKKHAANEPEIPVLTDIVELPNIDLSAIPVLTEEVTDTHDTAMELELDLIPEPIRIDPARKQAETEAVLAQLNAMEAEVQAEVTARIAQVQSPAAPDAIQPEAPTEFSIEIPFDAEYVTLPQTEIEIAPPIVETPAPPPAVTPAPASTLSPVLSEETLQQIAKLIETDVARILKTSLHQALAEELSQSLNLALDKTLSSMLDQHMMMIEETVRSTIADELKTQLAPFKRPTQPKS